MCCVKFALFKIKVIFILLLQNLRFRLISDFEIDFYPNYRELDVKNTDRNIERQLKLFADAIQNRTGYQRLIKNHKQFYINFIRKRVKRDQQSEPDFTYELASFGKIIEISNEQSYSLLTLNSLNSLSF